MGMPAWPAGWPGVPGSAALAMCPGQSGPMSAMAGMVARYVGTSHRIDLDALWRDLGVRLEGATVATDDAAPLAAIRKVIVAGPPGRVPQKVPPLAN